MKRKECYKCRFYQGIDRAGDFFQGVYSVTGCEIIIDCVTPKNSGFANSALKNRNNDCPDFKKIKWWRR